MRTIQRLAALVLLGSAVIARVGPARAADPVQGKNNPVIFDGVLWVKYDYLLEDISPDDSGNDRNGFAVDRVQLTFNSDLGERFRGRAKIEMENQNNGQIKTFLKLADVTMKSPFGLKAGNLRFGQTEGVISLWLEGPWGYRIVSRTVPDRYLGLGTTYLGAGFRASWMDGLLETDCLVANRTSFSDSVSGGQSDPKYKTFGARAYVRPIREGPLQGLGFGGYAQIAPRQSPWTDNRDLWYGGHAFFEAEDFTLGAEIDMRKANSSGPDATTSETTSSVLSGFARYSVTSRIELFARGDVVDFDRDKDDYEIVDSVIDGKPAQTTLMAGVSHAYSKTLRSVMDVSFRTITDNLRLDSAGGAVKVEPDDEVILSARIEARL
jgi:hypothetical protein